MVYAPSHAAEAVLTNYMLTLVSQIRLVVSCLLETEMENPLQYFAENPVTEEPWAATWSTE